MKRQFVICICALLALLLAAALASCGSAPAESGPETDASKSVSRTDDSEPAGQPDPVPESEGNEPGTEPSGAESAPPAGRLTEFANAAAGDTVTFGTWDQDGREGAEPIAWTVLYQGVGKTLVLSESVLECQCFRNGTDSEPYPECLYRDSDLRKFLNGAFYEGAFTEEEKKAVLLSTVTTEYRDAQYREQTYETQDRVFPLSVDEAARYVCGVGNKVFGIPSARVSAENPYELNSISGVPGVEKAMSWWLRDMGVESAKTAAVVYAAERQRHNDNLNVYQKAGVRPALWIVYDAAELSAYEKGEAGPRPDERLNGAVRALKPGDRLTFGKFDRNPYNMDGYEDLTWTVLEEADGSLLLLSDESVGQMPFTAGSPGETSWKESDLRTELNGTVFLDRMFSPQEKALLIRSRVVSTGEDDRTGGEATEDVLFVPDQTDLDRYLSASGAAIGSKYWLRSQLSWAPRIGYVSASGDAGSMEPSKSCGVRLMVRIARP